jgi:hypothetical protein
MQMIQSRNQSTHTYNEEMMTQIVTAVIQTYMAEFTKLQSKFEQLRSAESKA